MGFDGTLGNDIAPITFIIWASFTLTLAIASTIVKQGDRRSLLWGIWMIGTLVMAVLIAGPDYIATHFDACPCPTITEGR